jgi:hypothetical protein
MKKLLIDQPGQNGDILICLPIAKWYSNEYDIEWFCPKKFHITFRPIDYCKPVTEISTDYDKIIDMSFGIRSSTPLHKWWIDNQSSWQSFIIPKYLLADVPLRERWNLVWKRNKEKENYLYDKIAAKYDHNYIVTHLTPDCKINSSAQNRIIFEPIEDFCVFDWIKVLKNSKEIHCIDSLLCNFVEVIPKLISKPKFYYATSKVPNIWDKTLLVNNWRFI